jgi:hypothetical protein
MVQRNILWIVLAALVVLAISRFGFHVPVPAVDEEALPQAPSAFYGVAMLIPMLIGLGTWAIVIISIWRAMKAHESIARSMAELARKLPNDSNLA